MFSTFSKVLLNELYVYILLLFAFFNLVKPIILTVTLALFFSLLFQVNGSQQNDISILRSKILFHKSKTCCPCVLDLVATKAKFDLVLFMYFAHYIYHLAIVLISL